MSNIVDEDTGNRRWRTVAERLQSEITAGVFKPGDRLSNEQTMAERYGVHRHTLRRAVSELAAEGLLEVRHGRGTFVQASPVPYKLGAQTRFRRNIAGLSRDPGGYLIASSTSPAATSVASQLCVTPGDPVVRLDILREVDGVPLIYSEHWFPAARFPSIASLFEENQSITAALEATGIEGLRRRDSTIVTRIATKSEAHTLKLKPASPIMVWESLKVDGSGTPVDYGIALLAGERVQLVLDFE